MGAQLLHGLGVSFYEVPLRLVKLLDEFVHIIYRGHLEITSIVALSLGTLQESYAIHPSAWKWNSPKLICRTADLLRGVQKVGAPPESSGLIPPF
jgi:hypothetical protein